MRSIRIFAAAVCVLIFTSAPFGAAGQKKKGRRPVVIGEESVRAAEAERRRKERGVAGESPMPPMPPPAHGMRSEELGLVNPRTDDFDRAVEVVVRRYAGSDARARAKMRASISADEFSALIGFARRAAVFGLRERSAERIAGGLTALAMIEEKRVDFRDVLVALSLLHHSARRIGADADKLIRAAAALAERDISKHLLGFISRPETYKDLRASWGYEEVETEGGLGFIGRDFERYDPTYDMKKLVIDVARFVAADGNYLLTHLGVATNLPRVWLEAGGDNSRLDAALGRARAGAAVHGDLKPDAHPSHPNQMLIVFLLEMSDERAARDLLELSRAPGRRDFASLGLAEGRLFCLVIARSFEFGVKPFETSESLGRFSTGLAEILRRHARD